MQFTKEQLIEHAKKHIAHDVWLRNKFGETHKTPATVELARIALASLEAEPVAWRCDSGSIANRRAVTVSSVVADSWVEKGMASTPLYTAPPAPAVQLQKWTDEQCLEFLSIAFRHAEIKGDLELDDIRLGVKMVNGSRTAMLNGGKP